MPAAAARTSASSTRSIADRAKARIAHLRETVTLRHVAATVGVATLFVSLFVFFSALPGIIRGDSAPVAVALDVRAPSLDTTTGSCIPILVRPQSDPGSAGELHFIDQRGEGLVLAPGSYLIEVAGSPIAADGTVYDFDAEALPLSVGHGKADTSGVGRIELVPLDAEKTTRDDIDAAYQLASQGGCLGDEAVELKLIALKRIGVSPF